MARSKTVGSVDTEFELNTVTSPHPEPRIREKMMNGNTLGDLIKRCNACLENVPVSCYPIYAKLFEGTLIEKVIFRGRNFEEDATEYCRRVGFREPT